MERSLASTTDEVIFSSSKSEAILGSSKAVTVYPPFEHLAGSLEVAAIRQVHLREGLPPF